MGASGGGGGGVDFQASPEQRSRDQASEAWSSAVSETLQRFGAGSRELADLAAALPRGGYQGDLTLGPAFTPTAGPALDLSGGAAQPPHWTQGIGLAAGPGGFDDSRSGTEDFRGRGQLLQRLGTEMGAAEAVGSAAGGAGGGAAASAAMAGMSSGSGVLMGAGLVAAGVGGAMSMMDFFHTPGTARIGSAETVLRSAQTEANQEMTDSGTLRGQIRTGGPNMDKVRTVVTTLAPWTGIFWPKQDHN